MDQQDELIKEHRKNRSEMLNAHFPAISKEYKTVEIMIRGFHKLDEYCPLYLHWLFNVPQIIKQWQTQAEAITAALEDARQF